MKKRLFAILLSILTVISLLSACGKETPAQGGVDNPVIVHSSGIDDLNAAAEKLDEKQKEESKTDIPAADDETSFSDGEDASSPDEENNEEVGQEEILLTPEEEAKLFYTGDWAFFVPSFQINAASFSLRADGSFTAQMVPVEALTYLSDRSPRCLYTGTWKLVPAEGFDNPYGISLSLLYTDDMLCEGWENIGDFIFEELTFCDGQILASMTQLNNGDSFISMHLNPNMQGILAKGGSEDLELTEPRLAGKSFYARILKNRYGFRSEPGDFGFGQFVIFADEVTIGTDGYEIINEVRQSVPYIVGESEGTSELSGGNDGLMPYGSGVYYLTTDEDGVIIDAYFIPTDPPPSAEEALSVLTGFTEVSEMLARGMSSMEDGKAVLAGEYAVILALGTDTPEQFVREARYAVTSGLDVYRYDPVIDIWEWLEPSSENNINNY